VKRGSDGGDAGGFLLIASALWFLGSDWVSRTASIPVVNPGNVAVVKMTFWQALSLLPTASLVALLPLLYLYLRGLI
jgi:hypothetical protein